MKSGGEHTQPVIVAAEVTGGHDGQPELILKIRYENGVTGDAVMENALGIKLLAHCGASQLNELVGQPWQAVIEILQDNTGTDAAA
ncbi:MAG: hypothetical protein ACFHXK_15425 [bacterium]